MNFKLRYTDKSKFEVPRQYHAKVRNIPDERTLERLRRGVLLEDGKAKCSNITLLETTENNAWVEVVVHEGRNRLVRRILEAVGHPVTKLKRVSFAGLELGNLKPGQARVLTEIELKRLRAIGAKDRSAEREDDEKAGLSPPPPGFAPEATSETSDTGDE